jgi:hypothetical protein
LLLKQEAIAKSGQRVVIGEVLRSRLRFLAVSNLNLEPLIGVDEATGPLFYATL